MCALAKSDNEDDDNDTSPAAAAATTANADDAPVCPRQLFCLVHCSCIRR